MEPAVRDAAEGYDIVVMNGNEFYEILDRIYTCLLYTSRCV